MMNIDWTQFTPLSALIGGLLIGAAASSMILLNGRIAGISGIVGGLFGAEKNDRAWRLLFLLGMLISPLLYARLASPIPITIAASTPTLIVAGLLVGIGTRYASGCTSGHGVCGVARGSVRSLIATLSFMVSGFATVYVVRHLIGG